MTMMVRSVFRLLLAIPLLVACSAYPTTEARFGDAVRHVVESQRVTNAPADPEPPRQTDGQRADAALGVYRSDVTPPWEGAQSGQQSQSITVGLGGAGQR